MTRANDPAPDDRDLASRPAVPDAAIDCETAVRRLWDYLDGELPLSAAAAVTHHLQRCADCPPHFDFSALVRGAVRETACPAPSTAEEEALRARVRAALAGLTHDG